MGLVTVRIVPKAGRTSVGLDDRGSWSAYGPPWGRPGDRGGSAGARREPRRARIGGPTAPRGVLADQGVRGRRARAGVGGDSPPRNGNGLIAAL